LSKMIVNPKDVEADKRDLVILCEFGFRNAIELYHLEGHPKYEGSKRKDNPWNVASSSMPMDFSKGYSPAELFPYFDTEDQHGVILTHEDKAAGKVNWYVIDLRAGAMLSTDIGWLGKQKGALPDDSVLLDAPPYLPKCPKTTAGTNILYRLMNMLHPGSVDMGKEDYKLFESLNDAAHDDETIKSFLVLHSCQMSNEIIDGMFKDRLEFVDLITEKTTAPPATHHTHIVPKSHNTTGFSVKIVYDSRIEGMGQQEYIDKNIGMLKRNLTEAVKKVLQEKPADPVDHVIQFLQQERARNIVFTLDDTYKRAFSDRVLKLRKENGIAGAWELQRT